VISNKKGIAGNVSAWVFSPEKIRDQAGDVNLTRYKRCGILIQGVSEI